MLYAMQSITPIFSSKCFILFIKVTYFVEKCCENLYALHLSPFYVSLWFYLFLKGFMSMRKMLHALMQSILLPNLLVLDFTVCRSLLCTRTELADDHPWWILYIQSVSSAEFIAGVVGLISVSVQSIGMLWKLWEALKELWMACTTATLMKVPSGPIRSCLQCPLCFNLVHEATTISECLHTCKLDRVYYLYRKNCLIFAGILDMFLITAT